jgi:cytosine/adenosine deaminase-related metal-dependent hydrolase
MSQNKTLVRAGRMVPAYDEPAVADAAVVINGDTIESSGSYADLRAQHPDAQEIGGPRYLLIPGLVNGHSHGRGLTDFQRGALDNTLESWLLDTRKYKPVSAYDDCSLSAARLLASGVTTTMHNHILGNPADHENEHAQVIQAYAEAGIRLQFNPGVRNDNPFVYGDNASFLERLPQALREALTKPVPEGALTGDNFVEAVQALFQRFDNPMCRIGFGPLAPQWATEALLKSVRAAADELDRPIHVHAAQSIYQKVYGLTHLNESLIAWMDRIGLLGPRLVIGHCVWPTRDDIGRLASSGAGVTHHPSCNLRVRNGIAPAFHMLRAGVKVGLGLDGKSINDDDDFIQEMKVCFLLHRIPSLELHSDHLSAREVFRMATTTSADLLGFGDAVGRLEPGRKADMALLDYDAMCWPYTDPGQDPIDVLLYRGTRHFVDTVLVDGRVVVRDGRVTTVDEEEIGRRLAEASARPRTEQEEGMLRGLDTVQKHVIDYYRGWPDRVETEPYFPVNSQVDGLE